MSPAVNDDTRVTLEPWPLTSAEQALWFQYLHDPGDTSYLLPIVVDVRGDDATAKVEALLPLVLDRYPVLRSSPTWDARAHWVQGAAVRGSVVDAVELGDDGAWVDAVQQAVSAPFEDLSVEPPCRYGIVAVEDDHCVLWFVVHHIAADLHGAGILLQAFRDLLAGKSMAPPVSCSYLGEIETKYRRSARYAEDKAYWREEATLLPTHPPVVGGEGIEVLTRNLVPQEAEALIAAARSARRPFESVVQAAFCLALHALDNHDAVTVGVTCNLRHDPTVALACGYAINTVPVRSRLGARSVGAYLDDFVPRSRAARRHQRLPSAEIAAMRGAETGAPLFDDLLVFTLDRSVDSRQRWLFDPDRPEVEAGPYRLRRIAASRSALQCRSILTVCLDTEGLGIWLEYQPDRFVQPERVLDDIVGRFSLLLSDPDSPMPTMRGEKS